MYRDVEGLPDKPGKLYKAPKRGDLGVYKGLRNSPHITLDKTLAIGYNLNNLSYFLDYLINNLMV